MANSDWHEGNPLPGEAGVEGSVGEDTAVSSGAVDAPVEVEHVDPSVAAPGTTTSEDVSSSAVEREAGKDSGQTDHSLDYSKQSEGFASPGDGHGSALAAPEVSESEHVDLTGRDLSKNDEVPSARDGIAASLDARNSVEYSDGVCPLIASDDDVKHERESVSLGSVEMTSRQPFNVLTNPVVCPTCAKKVESHHLTWDPTNPGVRDCAIATANRAHPVSKEILAASDSGDDEKAERIAKRHPLGRRILEILGLREKSEV